MTWGLVVGGQSTTSSSARCLFLQIVQLWSCLISPLLAPADRQSLLPKVKETLMNRYNNKGWYHGDQEFFFSNCI